MKKLNNKGFTIVELVIVVAVIAILAAVLIPTVSGLIKTAQTSADVTLVKNVNLFLATERATEGKNATMQEALDDALEGGYDIEKLTPTNSDNHILWDQESDNFVLYANGKYNNAGAEVNVDENALYKLWNIADKTEGSKYSVYYTGKETTVNVNGVGFDAGTSSVATVNYVNTTGTAKSVVVRTNGGTLTVDAETDVVNHYGEGISLDIKAIDEASYHEYGSFGSAKILKGRIVVEENAHIGTIVVPEDSEKVIVDVNDKANVIMIENHSTEAVVNVDETEVPVITSDQYTAYIGTKGYETLEEALASAVNGDTIALAKDYSGTAKLEIIEKKIVLYMNERTIDINISEDITSSAISVSNGAELTINGNGKIKFTTVRKTQSIIYVDNSILNLENGTLFTDSASTYGIMACETAVVNCGAIGTAGPSITSYNACLSTNGGLTAVTYNVYSGSYTATRTHGEGTGDDGDCSVVLISNKGTTNTVNIYGGSFAQVGSETHPISNIFDLRYEGLKIINIYGGTYSCSGKQIVYRPKNSDGTPFDTAKVNLYVADGITMEMGSR